ncbi:MAG: hypothetical protein IKC09_05395 [Oscillospiraceae bacterium]|nr:hypothetical protein [Oscillospiraceae bacterium]MBR2889693.1 hypothetical protein [Oscillospiraceae bacterium]
MKDLLILLDGTFLRFAVCPFGYAHPGDRADPGDGKLCLIREIFPCVDEPVLKALVYAGEAVPEARAIWRQVSMGEGFHGG